jgi:arylsulfatase A-like enzyme
VFKQVRTAAVKRHESLTESQHRLPTGSRRLRGFWLCALTVALALAASVLAAAPREVQAATPRPNFIVIQTDDQPIEQFDGFWRDERNRQRLIMPNTQRLIAGEGIEFSSYLTPFPICSPSRASLLSGNYAHNTGVIRNLGPSGGWPGYQSNEIFDENLPVWLQRAGYRTAHFGKFLNYYGGVDLPEETLVPPGWDRWVTDNTDNSTRNFYGYSQNVDGISTGPIGDPLYGPDGGRDPLGCPWLAPGACIYHSDAMSLQAVEEIRNADRPFYIQLDYHTPHGDSRPPAGPEPASRHIDIARTTPLPKSPGFDEPDTSDKPAHIQALGRIDDIDRRQLRLQHQKAVEALQSVDEAVAWIHETLQQTGRLRNTYIFFTSDNGFFLGQHRIVRGKLMPYEAALGVPFAVRGPGIRKGVRSRELMGNQDVAPTILSLAGATAGRRMDGRSMVRFWREPNRLSRRAILVSSYSAAASEPPEEPSTTEPSAGAGVSQTFRPPNYVGIRLGPYKYIEYRTGERELYHLGRDPAELHNKADLPRWYDVQTYLDFALETMRQCRAAECRTIQEPWPPAPPAR